MFSEENAFLFVFTVNKTVLIKTKHGQFQEILN